MKAPSFAYAKPRSLDEVFALAEKHGEDAKLLAGGQTLLATLNMRLSSPALLIDITGLPGLAGIEVKGNTLRIGALTTHRTIEQSPEIARHLPLLAQAAPHIAHVAIRNAGTLGGSLAHGDPAAEWPACCVALDATIVIAAKSGERRVKAREFYRGLFETALGAGEVITAVEFPIPGAGYRSAFLELARRHGDYAIVGRRSRGEGDRRHALGRAARVHRCGSDADSGEERDGCDRRQKARTPTRSQRRRRRSPRISLRRAT